MLKILHDVSENHTKTENYLPLCKMAVFVFHLIEASARDRVSFSHHQK